MSVFIAFPVKAKPVQENSVEVNTSGSPPITEIKQVNTIAPRATTIKQWLSQSSTPSSLSQSPIQITGVRLNPTDDGIDVIVETAGGKALQSSSSSQGKSLIINIPNAQLQLPSGKEFRQENPVAGVASITVKAPDANSVQVIVAGIDKTPVGKVVQNQQGLILSVTSSEPIEILVTAEKRPEDVQDVPISITPLTKKEIEDADITSLSGISANTPNFSTFAPSRTFVEYSVRGLSNFNFLSRDPVAFYIDDVPYDYTGFLTVDLPDLERVEVLRGPQSTLYGRNAEAGVVNIITQKPTDKFEFNGSANYGNYNNLDLRASGSGPLVEDKLFFRLSGKYGSRDGFLKNTFTNSDVDYQSGGTGRAQLLWTPSKDLDISFNTSFDDYHDGATPLVQFGQRDPYKIQQNYNGFSDLNSNTQSLRVVYKNPDFRLTSITARRFSHRKFENEADLTTRDILTQVGEDQATLFSEEIRLQSPEDAKTFQWLFGGYFESRDFNLDADGFRYGADAVAYYRGLIPQPGRNQTSAKISETTKAIFAQASYKPIEPLTLTAGLRYESFNSFLDNTKTTFIPANGSPSFSTGATFSNVEKDGDIFLPRFVAEYRFNPNVMAYGSIVRGYRPPGVNYRAQNQETLTYEAEKSWNYEVGLKSSWLDNRLNVNLAVFHNPVNNYQEPVPDSTGLFRQIANAEVSITGFELEVKATPIDRLTVSAGFGFLDSEFTKYTNPFTGQNYNGKRPAYVPDFTYNLALQYRFRTGIFARVELQGSGTAFLDDANRFKQGPWAIVNARLGYELNNFGIYFFANNIFGTEYPITAVPFGSFGTISSYNAPATYGFQLRTQL
ncbi:TonB-dependent receptor [Aetokthonos hydrillicola Thurmond2011]|uniref:TonB-dependent receptor n=1 Tax=Aetokthonos hydrillicola Thurmond2011 TaxID=2712845 RepID=A0AAP5I2Q2_9CYAN|nr:TonB-dependent receptor [Aetokthonos hydrillicola]MBO3457403.1 TonB-dependent receptor [Aetokthonos hydrillicola CCALA 1050]MBW4589456.1 TonB-dependent receptor [Aetokthonos hydrillicola CCALA 1050]MDR9893699.1 TonB-dependent receptor [Aetokthonos hydrillicola Thurmond2011]